MISTSSTASIRDTHKLAATCVLKMSLNPNHPSKQTKTKMLCLTHCYFAVCNVASTFIHEAVGLLSNNN